MSLTVCVATWEGIHPFSIVQLDFFLSKKVAPTSDRIKLQRVRESRQTISVKMAR